MHVDIRQRRRPLLKLGLHLQDHPILVQLGEDGGDQPLAEGVVQRVVDQLRSEAEAGCGAAIDVQHRPQALVLLIAGHVTQDWNAVQPPHQSFGPDGELLGIGVFQRVLILRAAHPVLDRQILHRLHEQRDAVHLRELGLQAADHFRCAGAALLERLEVDQDAPAVERRVGAVDPDEGGQALYRRVLQDGQRQVLLTLRHGGEGDRLRGFGDAEDHAGVLDREEALGDEDVQQHGHDQCSDRHQQRGRLTRQHPAQGAAIALDQPVDGTAGDAVETALLGLGPALEQPGAHGRRERQRDGGRDENRHAQA